MIRNFLSLLLIVGLSFSVIGCGTVNGPPSQETSTPLEESFEIFSALELSDFMKLYQSGSYVMIDVRTPEEIAGGKIASEALEIDYYSDDFQANLDQLDKTRKYLVYCRSGRRSGLTMEIMENLGFSEAYDLNGGILEFIQAQNM